MHFLKVFPDKEFVDFTNSVKKKMGDENLRNLQSFTIQKRNKVYLIKKRKTKHK